MIKLEDIDSGDILEVDVTDLGEDYDRLKNEDKAYFRVSMTSKGRILGTFRKNGSYFGGKIYADDVIRKIEDVSFIWIGSGLD